jgi:hypothetical protein
MGQNVLNESLLRVKLPIEIDVLDADGHLASQAKEDLEFVIRVGQAGDAFAEIEDANLAA